MTLAESVRVALGALERVGYSAEVAGRDAEVLARYALGWDVAEWLVRQREPTSVGFSSAFDLAIARRCRREPVAYITGSREFYGRSFAVTPEVLIPRPETELLVDEALAVLADLRATGRDRPQVADVGTGNGCVAITIALESPDAEVLATDVSASALGVAGRNAARLHADTRVRFGRMSLLGEAADRFDLVVANPPYVAERDRQTLAVDVRDHEPALALFGGPDGLGVLRQLLPAAERALVAGGWLVVEFGYDQAGGVKDIMASSTRLAPIRVSTDLAGIPRVLVARKALASV